MKIFSMIKRIIYGEKYSSETYIASLKRKGYKIGDRCTFYNPQSTVLDSTPYMLEIGNDVKITAGVNILCHDASVFVLDRAGGGGIILHRQYSERLLLEIMFLLGVMLLF